jgi:8-oxo-dGTP pyrophosphatase MutT (NUDIX family)
MARIDHYCEPDAPKPNSMVPAVSAVVVNEAGELLLQRRSDNGFWALPGGAVELGESAGQAIVREVKEETGVDVEPTGIVGIYSDPNHIIEFSDGEVRQQFSVCFVARPVGGVPAPSDESTAVRFVAPAELEGLAMHPAQRLRIRHFLERRPAPFFS